MKYNNILLLIDNDCYDLEIKNISDILTEKFTESHVSLNGQLIEKSLIANYLPIATSKTYLKLNNYSWQEVTQYSKVILVVNDSTIRKELRIFAWIYRILTGKSVILFANQSYCYSKLFQLFYPTFLNIFFLRSESSFEFPEIIKIEKLADFKKQIFKEFEDFDYSREFEKGYKLFYSFYQYILNGGTDYEKIIENSKLDDYKYKNQLTYIFGYLKQNLQNRDEFLYYDAQFWLYPSLGGKLQVSIPGPGENKIHVFNSSAADYNFRNLKYKNVLVSTKDRDYFVLPFYKNDQATRQTVRFLVMNLYKVYNNSALVDFIIIYLFMKVSRMNDACVKTKYENVARLFIDRHKNSKTPKEFLKENEKHLDQLKKYFPELNEYDTDEIRDMLDEFIAYNFKLLEAGFSHKLDIVYVEESDVMVQTENKLDTFEFVTKSQINSIEINDSNWPKNLNYKCDDKWLQLNSSSPFYICTKNYQEFLDKINEIKWMKTIVKHTDKLVLKGGALVDLLSQRKPKDYDFMNIGMSNEEFLEFIIKFVKDERPEKIEFFESPVVLFHMTLKNGDIVEFIVNLEMSRNNLFNESYLPDQICFIPSENKLLSNESTLWSLNHGYCLLDMEKHPKSIRISSKMNKLGFNFYFMVENRSNFFKERLERYVWSISNIKKQRQTNIRITRRARCNPSFANRRSNEEGGEEDHCVISRGKIIYNKKIIFANKEAYLKHVSDLSQSEENTKSINIKFDGAYILPSEKTYPLYLANGIDWSF